jgi:hypothetical protein
MAKSLIGYRCVLTFTPPASTGKPRTPYVMDVGPNPMLTTKEDAQRRADTIRPILDQFQVQMLSGPGLDPGQSNLAYSTDVSPVFADLGAAPFSKLP